jgi:phosphomannomutase/phosphomannomutase/phosphoglucomutase
MSQIQKLPAFKAYDIRGRMPEQLNEFMVYCIGKAYAQVMKPQAPIAVGQDIRLSSKALSQALIAGLNSEGVTTVDIGLCGTEMIYFAAGQDHMGGGIMVTASHNPADYNGLKMVKEGSRPISSDTGLGAIEQETIVLMNSISMQSAYIPTTSLHNEQSVLAGYIAKLLAMIDVAKVKPLHVLVNGGNGCAGPFFDALAQHLPLKVTRMNHEPDGTFPNDVPNPMLLEQQQLTAKAVVAAGADLGIAWDGDFDRCFFFDENGRFIEGYYLVGLLAEQLLKKSPKSAIVHDPRLEWNTIEKVQALGGKAVVCKCGHSFIKDKMREEDAVYGGEMSAHHYFRDFFYCDSGMIPWLLIIELLSQDGRPFSQVVDQCMMDFPCSGEINFTIANAKETLARIQAFYAPNALTISHLDGVSMEFTDWRFNVRSSNTEPVVRLNVESRGNAALLNEKVAELNTLLVG